VLKVAGIGWLASAFRNVNNAPTIVSAKKVLRRRCLMFGLFIVFNFLSFVLAFLGSSLLSGHFHPFTDVLRKILELLTRKVEELCAFCCGGGCRSLGNTFSLIRCDRKQSPSARDSPREALLFVWQFAKTTKD
jgi:hypothetical protein